MGDVRQEEDWKEDRLMNVSITRGPRTIYLSGSASSPKYWLTLSTNDVVIRNVT